MKQKIISAYHHSFAGGSKNTCRLLDSLVDENFSVDAFFFERPQYFTYMKSKIQTYIYRSSEGIHSDVMNNQDLGSLFLTNKLVDKIQKERPAILFGANLFPYCKILLDAKMQYKNITSFNLPKLILHPVGSDIWQIGSQVKPQVKWLLEHSLVDKIVTYSGGFISEIKEQFSIKRRIDVLPPVLESQKFFSLSEVELSKRKKRLGFGDDTFIIHHHSSMRPIKCPEIIIEIALKASEVIVRDCVLIMVGPIPRKETIRLNLKLKQFNGNSIFTYVSIYKRLKIYWTGVLSNVEYLMQVSDVELNASLHDSFNLSLMEAMACGIPVITSDIVGIREHIDLSQGGFSFATRRLDFEELNCILRKGELKNILFDIDSAVNDLKVLSENEEKRKQIGQQGAQYVLREFSPQKVVKEFHKILNCNGVHK